MTENTILKRNLLALSSSDPQLSAQLGYTRPSRSIEFMTARSGEEIPVLNRDGKAVPLHSRYNPVREGEKLLSTVSGGGFLMVLGLGGGYHVLPFLKERGITHIVIIDKDLEMLRGVLERIDLRELLLDPRVKLLIDKPPGEIQDFILKNYIPAISGGLNSISLFSRINMEADYFKQVVGASKEIISPIADDYTVQVKFGQKWFINTITNLEAAEKSTTLLRPLSKVIIAGAGPSLEEQMGRIKKLMTEDTFLIATDTALPTLLSYDVIPNTVISIDCQQISYHHFLKGLPPKVPLVLDLASPPVLTRQTDNLIFFSSGHPFSRFVTNYWRKFPAIDVSGGNVSHAALSLASLLGARTIYLAGVDFSFPGGKTYSRDSYQYSYYRSLENRLTPLESAFFTSIFKNRQVITEHCDGFNRYTTHSMISYKERMEKAISRLSAKVIPMAGKGLPLSMGSPKKQPAGPQVSHLFSQGPCGVSWKEFLEKYQSDIEKLNEPNFPVADYLNSLSHFEKDLWTTQYPAAASIREHLFKGNSDQSKLLKATRQWTIDRVKERI